MNPTAPPAQTLHFLSLRTAAAALEGFVDDQTWSELATSLREGRRILLVRQTPAGTSSVLIDFGREGAGITVEVAVTAAGQVLIPLLLPPGGQLPLPVSTQASQAPPGSQQVSPAAYKALRLHVMPAPLGTAPVASPPAPAAPSEAA